MKVHLCLCLTAIAAATTAWPGDAPKGGEIEAVAARLPGRWIRLGADRKPEKVAHLDFFRSASAFRRLAGASSQTLAGLTIHQAGSIRDCRRYMSPDSRGAYALTETNGTPLLAVFPFGEKGKLRRQRIRIVAGSKRQEDRLYLSAGDKEWAEYARAPESIHVAKVPLAAGKKFSLTARCDYASDYHTALDSLFAWALDVGKSREVVWDGQYALAGAVSPGRALAAVVLSETASPFGGGQVVLVNLKTGATTETKLVARGIEHMASSASPKPSLTWIDDRTFLFTSGEGRLMKRKIELFLYDVKTGKAVALADETTGKKAKIEPAIGHDFFRDEDGLLLFRTGGGTETLYPLDLKKKTVGKKIVLPRKRGGKSLSQMIREAREKAGAGKLW